MSIEDFIFTCAYFFISIIFRCYEIFRCQSLKILKFSIAGGATVGNFGCMNLEGID